MGDWRWVTFEWDPHKDLINQEKHGVPFQVAVRLRDTSRVIPEDVTHSTGGEKRYYCLGKVGDGVLTVRFTYREDRIRILGSGYWLGKESRSMKNRIRNTDEPMGNIKVVADFLPSPNELAFRENTVKVTIALSKASVDFFKHEAEKHDVSYQKMIRRLLDEYAIRHTR